MSVDAVLVGFPDDLVDELDDAGFLVGLGDFLVQRQVQVHRGLILVHFVQGFGADAVEILQRLFDFTFGRQGELHRAPGVETHGVEHRRIERVADRHLQRAVLHLRRAARSIERRLWWRSRLRASAGTLSLGRSRKGQFSASASCCRKTSSARPRSRQMNASSVSCDPLSAATFQALFHSSNCSAVAKPGSGQKLF